MTRNIMREMNAAGTYYDRNGDLLKQEVESHYSGARGPGSLPLTTITHKTRAIIVPNSPYNHCGQCSAWAYKELAESPFADVYIIIATNHHSQESGVTNTAFNTPLGLVRVDQEFTRALTQKGTIGYDDEIHARDHAIEVQLPWLIQAKFKESEHLKIVPILVSGNIDMKKLALDIKECLVDLKRNAVFIVSTDFTHYGPLFHYVPFSIDVQKSIYDLDAQSIDLIKAQNADGFASFVEKQFMTIDGASAIELLLRVIRPCNVRLEQYYTSGDILGDYKNCVSYASIVFEEK